MTALATSTSSIAATQQQPGIGIKPQTSTSVGSASSSAASASKSGSPVVAVTTGPQTSTTPITSQSQKPIQSAKVDEKVTPADQIKKVDDTTKTLGVTGKVGSAVQSSAAESGAKTVSASAGQKPAESKDELIARLLALEPKELLKEIVSGKVPVSLLDRVTERLPAELLQEAVDFLTNTDSASCSSESSAPDTKTTSLKRKLEEFDPSKVKSMKVDELLPIFQQTIRDILSGMFKADMKTPTTSENAATLRSLTPDDRSLVVDMQKSYNIKDITTIVDALRTVQSLDSGIVEALSQIDLTVVRRSMAGNAQAERVGGLAMKRLAIYVSRNKKPMLKTTQATTTTSSSVVSQSGPNKRPASNVPSLFATSQSQPEKKQRFGAPSIATQRPLIRPESRARLPSSDLAWRPAPAPLLSTPRFRPTGPRGYGPGRMGY